MCRTGTERDELIYQRGLVHHARHLHPKSQGRHKLLKLSSVLAKQSLLRPYIYVDDYRTRSRCDT